MLKRFLDLFFSLIIFIICLPLLGIISCCIALESRGPIYYLSKRVGKDGVIFTMFKFRSMYLNNGEKISAGYGDSRITKVGKIIRKYHLDELFQLLNVIKGDMSLIGYRPEDPYYIQYYPQLWNEILKSKPGITGLAAVKCAIYEYKLLESKVDLDKIYIHRILPKKLKCDLIYVRNQSFKLDLYILFLTLKHILHL